MACTHEEATYIGDHTTNKDNERENAGSNVFFTSFKVSDAEGMELENVIKNTLTTTCHLCIQNQYQSILVGCTITQ